MFYKFCTLPGWFAKQELSQVNIVLGCHHLETGRSSKTFAMFLFRFINWSFLMGYEIHLPVCLKFRVNYDVRRKLIFLKDGVGQGLIPVANFSSRCHLGAHAVAKSIFMPHFLLFNHPISITSSRLVSHIGLFHLSVGLISEWNMVQASCEIMFGCLFLTRQKKEKIMVRCNIICHKSERKYLKKV